MARILKLRQELTLILRAKPAGMGLTTEALFKRRAKSETEQPSSSSSSSLSSLSSTLPAAPSITPK